MNTPHEIQLSIYKEQADRKNQKIKDLEAENQRLLDMVKMAYRKHHLDDMTIGWEELSDALHTELCNSMGDKGFCDWLHELKGGDE